MPLKQICKQEKLLQYNDVYQVTVSINYPENVSREKKNRADDNACVIEIQLRHQNQKENVTKLTG